MNSTDHDAKPDDAAPRNDNPDVKGNDSTTGDDDVADTQERPSKLPVYTTSPKFLWVPVIACIVFAGLLAIFLNFAGLAIVYEPVNEDLGFGAVLVNALIFIGIGAGSAFVLIKIVRKRGINALEKVMMVAFLVLGTFITYLYGEYMLALIDQYVVPLDIAWSYIWLAISFGITAFLVYLYASPKFGSRLRVHNIVVVVFGVLIGSYLPLVIGTWTAIVILIGFSLYDIYSVKKGPIKEMMAKMDPDNAVPFSGPVDVKDMTIDIGIGDLAFYSMLTSITLISTDWGGPALVAATGNMFLYLIPFAATVVGVLIGVWISFELVKKNKILPGLPMSVFIGLGLMSLAIVIFAAIF